MVFFKYKIKLFDLEMDKDSQYLQALKKVLQGLDDNNTLILKDESEDDNFFNQ
jgi:hypothetical protein